LATGVGILQRTGLWPYFYRDVIEWLAQGHYASATQFGYAVTLGDELHKTLAPFSAGFPLWLKLLFADRLFVAAHYLLMAALPITGLAGGFFPLRKTREQKRALTLLLLPAFALVAATTTYATSMNMASNDGPAELLGFIALFACAPKWRFRIFNSMLI